MEQNNRGNMTKEVSFCFHLMGIVLISLIIRVIIYCVTEIVNYITESVQEINLIMQDALIDKTIDQDTSVDNTVSREITA